MKNGIFKRMLASLSITLMIPVVMVAQSYQVQTLNGLGGGAGANSINNRGQILGFANNSSNTASHAALWNYGSTPIDLGAFGGPNTNSTVAFPVKSNSGLIV